MPSLGKQIDTSKATKGVPPLILQVQPDSYFELGTPEELKQWETDVRNFYGVEVDARAIRGACETCSGGCSDDCGIARVKAK